MPLVRCSDGLARPPGPRPPTSYQPSATFPGRPSPADVSEVARRAGAPCAGRGRVVVRSCEAARRTKGAKLRNADADEATRGQGVLTGCGSAAQGHAIVSTKRK